MGRLLQALLVASLVIAGCQLISEEPRFAIEVTGSDGRPARLKIADGRLLSGVTDGINGDLRARVHVVQVASVPGAPTRLFLAWVLSPCEREILLRVTSDSDGVELMLETGNEGEDCDAIGITYGVRLDFVVPVDPSDVRASVFRNGVRFVEPDTT